MQIDAMLFWQIASVVVILVLYHGHSPTYEKWVANRQIENFRDRSPWKHFVPYIKKVRVNFYLPGVYTVQLL